MNDMYRPPHSRRKKTVRRAFYRLLYLVPVAFLSDAVSDRVEEDVLVRETQIGQRMPIFLGDATQVVLGGDTSITVTDTVRLRKIALNKGEVAANIHHDDGRPFEVVVDRLVIYDVGTRFVASTHDGTSNVSVTEGELRLFERDSNGTRQDPLVSDSDTQRRVPAVLAAGDQARVEQLGDGSMVVYRAPRDLQAALRRTQWLHGVLDATQWRLDEVVWEFNRYNRSQIVIDDPQLAQLKLGGIHDLSNVEGFVNSLGGTYHIQVTRAGDGVGTNRSYHLRASSRQGRGRGK